MKLSAFLALPENANANMVVPLSWCPHLEQVSRDPPERLDAKTACEAPDCGHVGENWICLVCQAIYCSRYVKEHMVIHSAENEGHIIALSFSDLSVWCRAF